MKEKEIHRICSPTELLDFDMLDNPDGSRQELRPDDDSS